MMSRLQQGTILCLIFAYFNTIFCEMFFIRPVKFSHFKLIILDYIELPFSLPTLIDGTSQKWAFIISFTLLVILLATVYYHQMLIFYIALLQLFEVIPLLIDLINLLLIYQSHVANIRQWNIFNWFHLSLAFTVIRLIISLEYVHRKCRNEKTRQVRLLLDFALFTLVNVLLMRDSSINFIQIGRRIMLNLLYFHLNSLLSKKNFPVEFTRSTSYSRYAPVQCLIIEPIILLCWIGSFFIIALLVLSVVASMIINDHGKFFNVSHMQKSFAVYRFELAICAILLWIIYWKIRQSRIVCFCVDYNAMPKSSSTESTMHYGVKPTK